MKMPQKAHHDPDQKSAADWVERGAPITGARQSRTPSMIRMRTFKEQVLDWFPRELEAQAEEIPSHASQAIIEALRRLPSATQRELRSMIESLDVEVSEELWGPAPELSEVVESMLWHEAEDTARRDRTSRDSRSVGEVARLMGLSEDSVLELVENRSLSAIRVAGAVVIPDWQFDSENSLIPGVQALIPVFPGTDAALAEWVERQHPDLGESPRVALLRGRIDEVVSAASSGAGIA